mgnify:CR=1 FL=1
MAVASLVLGIVALVTSILPIINNLSFLLAILGIVFAIVGLVGVSKGKKSGKGLGVAGLVLSVIAFILVLVMQSAFSAALDQAMEESGLPQGIYVTDCIADSPAYNAGIQPGDIITWINGSKTNTMKDFQNQVESLKPGDKVNVAVQRNGKDSYKEIEYPVTIGER